MTLVVFQSDEKYVHYYKDDVSDAEELTRELMVLLVSISGKYYSKISLLRR